MTNKQFFAQLAVFTLLAGNVAAYYYFWPSEGGWSSGEAKIPTPEKSAPQDGGAAPSGKAPAPRASVPLAVSPPPPGFPEISEPMPPQKNASAGDPVSSKNSTNNNDSDAVHALQNLIQKQAIGAAPQVSFPSGGVLLSRNEQDKVPSLPAPPNDLKKDANNPALPLLPEIPITPGDRVTEPLASPDRKNAGAGLPMVLPPMKAEPLLVAAPGVGQPARSPGLVPAGLSASPVAQQPQSPWLVNMETVGGRNRVILRLPRKGFPGVEFKILCDRVDMQAPQNTMQAVGKVTFVGAGLKGSCERLTLSYSEMRIVFEDGVEVAHDTAGAAASGLDERQSAATVLRGAQMTWEAPSPARAPGESGLPAGLIPRTPPIRLNEPR